MENERFVLCGILVKPDGYSDIVCDTTNGDAILMDNIQGNVIIEQLTIPDPTPMKEEILIRLVRNMKAEGAIVTKRYLYMINNDYVSVLEYGTNNVLQTFAFDTAIEFEGSIEI